MFENNNDDQLSPSLEDVTDRPQESRHQTPPSPLFFSDRSTPPTGASVHTKPRSCAIIIPPIERPQEYQAYQDNTVEEVLKQAGIQKYLVRLWDGRKLTVSLAQLRKLEDGPIALATFEKQREPSSASSSEEAIVPARKRIQPRREATKVAEVIDLDMSSDELATTSVAPIRGRHLFGQRKMRNRQSESESVTSGTKRRGRKKIHIDSESGSGSSEIYHSRNNRSKRSTARPNYKELPLNLRVEGDTSDEDRPTKRRRGKVNKTFDQVSAHEGTRRSSRARRQVNDMHEVDEDDIPEVTVRSEAPKAVGAKEAFKPLPKDDKFRQKHNQHCETCSELGSNDQKGRLIYCQGCSFSYHQRCLGPRNSREHLVTKIDDQDFVLQCRRCVQIAIHKDRSAPRQSICQTCHKSGDATRPFRSRQTTREEQKARDNNDGEDPITEVASELINNADNVLFRCVNCCRAFHIHHLPPRDTSDTNGINDNEGAEQRFAEYSRQWTCQSCHTAPNEIDAIVAWRPIASHDSNAPPNEDEREYLIKWRNLSYFKCLWMPGAWVWGVTMVAMRNAFAKRDDTLKLTTEDAIPEDYLRVDIIFDVKYTNVVKSSSEKVDKARIKEIEQALVKFKGLGYDDVVWEPAPSSNDSERFADFKNAYEDWVAARYIHLPKQSTLNAYVTKIRAQNFAKQLEMTDQPANLTGGKLMKYQTEGLNWLYYQWHKNHNAILADEMGLGKTIQVIGFIATLKQHGCWPFLVVVPNSTCANWRREIKLWAPSLRIVMYFGSAEAKKLAIKHELFHPSTRDLKCHVVVTSYDAAQDDEFRKVFRGVSWMGLVVDEGQRLKSDKNLLYGALNSLRIPFKLLLTGTPLQNKPRELFNLLQFLDTTIDAQALEVEYENLTKENVPRLHELLRPFFLRRTKAQVLDFLPSMAQIIIPVTLTVVQKKLYKSILAKNTDLIKSIFGGRGRLMQNERANLNNILMQLRKCLCHPFVYNRDIEERSSNATVSHRNLVDASSKLQLLELMLPKLQERGHRVLIFSQFLNMLDIVEDFLDGLGLFYQRLDGSMNSLQKQKRIDEFNAPNSPLFTFLLSTRAGGVGINLATADTVIILDPDFNPHQDIQALSRAHRIGQKKKVLVFQLTTRATAEEKIMQIGKKKMALDHVLIEQMDAEDDEGIDLESILRHGTEALFQDDSENIRYDSQSVDLLLDRSQIEDTSAGKDNSAESQFSFARVWANDKGTLEDTLGNETTKLPDHSVWENILKEREEEVAREAAARDQVWGRGKRKRQAVDYASESREVIPGSSPTKRKGPRRDDDDSDTDFQEEKAASEADDTGNETEEVDVEALRTTDKKVPSRSRLTNQTSPSQAVPFKRVTLSPIVNDKKLVDPKPPSVPPGAPNTNTIKPHPCLACSKQHPAGYCPLKHAGIEHCPLCGIAHYGHYRTCPHLSSVTQCQKMLDAIKESNESHLEKKLAKQYIVGIIADLTRRRRLKEQESNNINTGGPMVPIPQAQVNGAPRPPVQMPTMTTQTWPLFGDDRDRTGVRPSLESCIAKGLIRHPNPEQLRVSGNFLVLPNGIRVRDVHGAMIPSGNYTGPRA